MEFSTAQLNNTASPKRISQRFKIIILTIIIINLFTVGFFQLTATPTIYIIQYTIYNIQHTMYNITEKNKNT